MAKTQKKKPKAKLRAVLTDKPAKALAIKPSYKKKAYRA